MDTKESLPGLRNKRERERFTPLMFDLKYRSSLDAMKRKEFKRLTCHNKKTIEFELLPYQVQTFLRSTDIFFLIYLTTYCSSRSAPWLQKIVGQIIGYAFARGPKELHSIIKTVKTSP